MDTQKPDIAITEETHFVFYGDHDQTPLCRETVGCMVRENYDSACRTAALLEQCGYRTVNIRRAADLNE
jgi:hypothetical protein